MVEESNIEAIKDCAIQFLHLDIVETKIPFIIQHPFWNSSDLYYQNRMVNILEEPETYSKIVEEYEKRINDTKRISEIIWLLCKPYRIAFFKYIESFLSLKDFSYFLGEIWIESEDPNQDPNAPTKTIIRWFKKADKKFLMTESEYKTYQRLPDCINVYRGVGVGRNPKGISYTDDFKEAEWFAKRFDTFSKKGYILTKSIDKKHVLAYFERRGEKEIVVDRKYLKDIEDI